MIHFLDWNFCCIVFWWQEFHVFNRNDKEWAKWWPKRLRLPIVTVHVDEMSNMLARCIIQSSFIDHDFSCKDIVNHKWWEFATKRWRWDTAQAERSIDLVWSHAKGRKNKHMLQHFNIYVIVQYSQRFHQKSTMVFSLNNIPFLLA